MRVGRRLPSQCLAHPIYRERRHDLRHNCQPRLPYRQPRVVRVARGTQLPYGEDAPPVCELQLSVSAGSDFFRLRRKDGG